MSFHVSADASELEKQACVDGCLLVNVCVLAKSLHWQIPNDLDQLSEIPRKQALGEFRGIPNDETIAATTPRNDGVGVEVIDHIVSLGEERGRHVTLEISERLGKGRGRKIRFEGRRV